MGIVIGGIFIILCCLVSILRLFAKGHTTLGVIWIILYIISFFLTLGTGIPGVIPLCILCIIGFLIA